MTAWEFRILGIAESYLTKLPNWRAALFDLGFRCLEWRIRPLPQVRADRWVVGVADIGGERLQFPEPLQKRKGWQAVGIGSVGGAESMPFSRLASEVVSQAHRNQVQLAGAVPARRSPSPPDKPLRTQAPADVTSVAGTSATGKLAWRWTPRAGPAVSLVSRQARAPGHRRRQFTGHARPRAAACPRRRVPRRCAGPAAATGWLGRRHHLRARPCPRAPAPAGAGRVRPRAASRRSPAPR